MINDGQIEEIEEAVAQQVDAAVTQAEADPNPALEDRFNDALAEQYPYEPK